MSAFGAVADPVAARVPGLQLHLTAEEQQLFELLLKSVAFNGKNSTLRVAGGWVRDRILQKDSNDIDIALDDQSGIEFANGVNAYLQSLGMETRTIAVIMANPDQSKHLETANLRVLGFEIDCVHLRAETYSDTRIPEIRVGTALEDALRRDFNINALFYNINDGCVEDFTGRGVKDLQAGLLCTPLPADVTFHDDPLRVLRAIRFASRLNYTLDWSLIAAARQEVIRVAMQHKVSRERVCKEIDGMLQHSHARPALSAVLLHDLGMLDVCLPLHLYLSADGSASGSTNTAPIPHYRVSRYCHPLCALWFDEASGTELQQCAACREYQFHSKELATCSDGCLNWPCWMSMSVEVTMWVQALLRHKFQASPLASSSDSHWILALRQHLAWQCRGADLTDVNADLNSHCEAENNVKILFWSSLLAVAGGITIQEVQVAPPTAPSGGGKKGQQHQQQHVPKDLSLSERILREQLKMDNHTAKGCQVVLDAVFSLLELLQLDQPQAIVAFEHVSVTDYIANYRAETVLGSRLDILSVAHWLRSVKERWEDALVVAWGFVLAWIHRHRPGFTPLYRPYDTASRLEGAADDCFAQLQSFLAPSDPSRTPSVLVMVLDRFATFVQAIDAHRLHDIWLMKPLLDGGALQRHLQAKGPVMGKLMEAQILWQIQFRFSFATADETTAALVAHLHTVLAEETANPSFNGKTR